MDKKQKVWIHGCEGKGADVIQKLVALGGKKPAAITTELAFDPGLIFSFHILGLYLILPIFQNLPELSWKNILKLNLMKKQRMNL